MLSIVPMSVQGVTSCFVEQRLGHSLLSIVPMSVQGVTSCFVEQRLGHSLLSIVPMSVQGVTSCFVEQRLGHSLLSIVPMSVQGVTGCFVHTPAWTFHVFFSTFFRLTSDFDNFGFFQAPGSNPQGSNPTNELVELCRLLFGRVYDY